MRDINGADKTFTFHSGYILIYPLLQGYHPCLIFTFHSGYILMEMAYMGAGEQKAFTFHSGYILITIKIIIPTLNISLHSILVIF